MKFFQLPAALIDDGKNKTIVPVNALDDIPEGEANLILGSTLFLLSYGLKTDNVTLVLDSCHSGGGVRGNLVYRATLDDELISPSQREQAFQDELVEELKLT